MKNLPAPADLVQTSGPRAPLGHDDAPAHPAVPGSRARRRAGRRAVQLAARGAALASLVAIASAAACDKGMGGASGSAAAASAEPVGPRLDLTSKPDILFQVFGERDDPRMIPVAALKDGALQRIELDAEGWKSFDGLYMRSPATIALYHDGRKVGDATVRQGMWEKPGEPLYSLPSCRLLTPLAALTLGDGMKAGYTVEYLASTATLGRKPSGTSMPADVATRAAREVAYGVGDRGGITQSTLDSLDFRAVAVHTGASAEPTLVASFIDPSASEGATDGLARHVFAIADRSGDRYAATFTHSVNGPGNGATYRRYVDHLDLTGDGIDEIVLEGWQSGGDTYLMVLGYKGGRWEEVFRGRSSWCIEKEKR